MSHALRRTLLLFAGLIIIFGLAACHKKPIRYVRGAAMNVPAFWVWHRSSPLTTKETNALSGAGVQWLYWQAAEFSWKEKQWTMNRIASPRVPV